MPRPKGKHRPGSRPKRKRGHKARTKTKGKDAEDACCVEDDDEDSNVRSVVQSLVSLIRVPEPTYGKELTEKVQLVKEIDEVVRFMSRVARKGSLHANAYLLYCHRSGISMPDVTDQQFWLSCFHSAYKIPQCTASRADPKRPRSDDPKKQLKLDAKHERDIKKKHARDDSKFKFQEWVCEESKKKQIVFLDASRMKGRSHHPETLAREFAAAAKMTLWYPLAPRAKGVLKLFVHRPKERGLVYKAIFDEEVPDRWRLYSAPDSKCSVDICWRRTTDSTREEQPNTKLKRKRDREDEKSDEKTSKRHKGPDGEASREKSTQCCDQQGLESSQKLEAKKKKAELDAVWTRYYPLIRAHREALYGVDNWMSGTAPLEWIKANHRRILSYYLFLLQTKERARQEYDTACREHERRKNEEKGYDEPYPPSLNGPLRPFLCLPVAHYSRRHITIEWHQLGQIFRRAIGRNISTIAAADRPAFWSALLGNKKLKQKWNLHGSLVTDGIKAVTKWERKKGQENLVAMQTKEVDAMDATSEETECIAHSNETKSETVSTLIGMDEDDLDSKESKKSLEAKSTGGAANITASATGYTPTMGDLEIMSYLEDKKVRRFQAPLNIIGIDPGRKDLLYIHYANEKDPKKKFARLSHKQWKQDCGFPYRAEKIEKLKQAIIQREQRANKTKGGTSRLKAAFDQLSEDVLKTADYDVFMKSLRDRSDHDEVLFEFYHLKYLARIKFWLYRKKQKAIRKMIKRILGPYADQKESVLVAWGNAQFAPGAKGHAPTPCKMFRRAFEKHERTVAKVDVDEWNTSQSCYRCLTKGVMGHLTKASIDTYVSVEKWAKKERYQKGIFHKWKDKFDVAKSKGKTHFAVHTTQHAILKCSNNCQGNVDMERQTAKKVSVFRGKGYAQRDRNAAQVIAYKARRLLEYCRNVNVHIVDLMRHMPWMKRMWYIEGQCFLATPWLCRGVSMRPKDGNDEEEAEEEENADVVSDLI